MESNTENTPKPSEVSEFKDLASEGKYCLKKMSFEELLRLKEKVGAKTYNDTVFGVTRKKNFVFKRCNKNRPREISSKIKAQIKPPAVVKKKTIIEQRDPRFDSLCGSYDGPMFKTNYSFLKNIKKKEIKELKMEFESTEDPERKRKIKLLIQRLDNQIREQEKREKEQTECQRERQEFRQKIKEGEKPIYKKKSEKTLDNLINKYEELKKNNKLQKHIEKRSKKLAIKDIKNY